MRALVLLAAVGLALGGCGEEEPRDAVDRYIRQANAVQREYVPDFRRANEAYLAYSRNELTGDAAVTRLQTAGQRIQGAHNRLTALDPPREARALHSKLLRVYDLNLDFAEQTVLLARYLDGAADALQPLERANEQLRAGLRQRGAERQARTLRRFVASVDKALALLRSHEVPFVLLPTHGDQVRRLKATRDLSDRLRSALENQDAKRVAQLLVQFRRGDANLRPRRALARQAIRQYDRRFKQLNEAYAEVQREQSRLEETLD